MGVSQHGNQILPHFLRGMSGQDAAVHDGFGFLRQRIVRVATVDPGRDACRVQGRVVDRVVGKPLDRLFVGRSLHDRAHVRCPLTGRDRRHLLVIAA